jgi:hypothetical protein
MIPLIEKYTASSEGSKGKSSRQRAAGSRQHVA